MRSRQPIASCPKMPSVLLSLNPSLGALRFTVDVTDLRPGVGKTEPLASIEWMLSVKYCAPTEVVNRNAGL